MKLICLTVGKKHDVTLAPAITHFQKRLNSYIDFSFDYIPSSNKNEESEVILRRIKTEDIIILLDETGEMINNTQLAKIFENSQLKGVKRIIIIIGGAYGVSDEVREISNHILSISKLVFPHQLMRLIVTEQLYRTFNLLAGGKYHHD